MSQIEEEVSPTEEEAQDTTFKYVAIAVFCIFAIASVFAYFKPTLDNNVEEMKRLDDSISIQVANMTSTFDRMKVLDKELEKERIRYERVWIVEKVENGTGVTIYRQ